MFQTKKDPSLWTCPFHPPLQLFFVIRNTSRLHDFDLAKIKVWNYWTADGVSKAPPPSPLLLGRLTDGSTLALSNSLSAEVAKWVRGGPTAALPACCRMPGGAFHTAWLGPPGAGPQLAGVAALCWNWGSMLIDKKQTHREVV